MLKHLLLCSFFLMSTPIFIQNGHAQVSLEVVRAYLEKNQEIRPQEEGEPKNGAGLAEELAFKLSSPRATMKTYLKAMVEYKKSSYDLKEYLNEAILALNLSEIEADLRLTTGRQVAEKLVFTLDRLALVDYETIPENLAEKKWIFKEEEVELNGNKVRVEISIGKDSDGLWRFTPTTVKNIGQYYLAVAKRPLAHGVVENTNLTFKIKEFMSIWGQDRVFFLTKAQWLGFGILFFISIFVSGFVRIVFAAYVRRLSTRKAYQFTEKDIVKYAIPLAFFTFSLIWLLGINFIELSASKYDFLARTFYIWGAISFIWSVLKVTDLITMHFVMIAAKTPNKFDDILVPMISKTAKFLVFAFGSVLVAHSLTFDVRGILAGLGLGGIAVALAAKDTIANLFGSVTLILDRPFQIGDYVLLDKGVEGTVEQIGFRSTRIRTPIQSLVSLPNSVLANMSIDNYGMRKMRRFRTIFQLDMTTPIEKIEEFCDRMKYVCSINPMLETNRSFVFVHEITDKAVNVQFTIFIKTKISEVEQEERHKILVEAMKVARELEIKFTQPSSTMLLVNNDSVVTEAH